MFTIISPHRILLVVAISSMLGTSLHAQQELSPGAVLIFEFPDLPPTLHGMNQKKAPVPAISVRLPDDYAAEKTFPLLVFLHGGIGSDGRDLSYALSIVGKSGFIVANFPLFKTEKNNPAEPWGGVRIGIEDHQVMSHAYQTFLSKIHETIPNIDAKTSVLGGYSNGAHAVTMLLSTLDANILKSFGGFYILDAGIEWTSYPKTEVLKNHHILFVVGAGRPKNEDWWRGHVVDRIKYFEEVARQAGMNNWRFVFLEGIGHDTPQKYFPVVNEWALELKNKRLHDN